LNRRTFLTLAGTGLASVWAAKGAPPAPKTAAPHEAPDDAFLDEMQQRCFSYFQERTDPITGLTLDRGNVDGGPYTLDERPTANIAVTGFGLVAFCIGAQRGWLSRMEAQDRVRTALRFMARQAPHEKGWFYHWMHLFTGERAAAYSTRGGLSEISTIDTALFLGGVVAAREYFRDDDEIVMFADEIYSRIDFQWMLDPKRNILLHGWTPERGFIRDLWNEYSEASLLYILAIGSPSHPIPADAWYAWKRNVNTYGSYRFIGTAPLFTEQYSHAFIDFRGRREHRGDGIDWFANSVTATRAHRQFCIDLHPRFSGYTDKIWGITASRSVTGYTAWGGPPLDPRIDGTVVPSAPGGSLMFTPDICIPALRAMGQQYGHKIYCRYGFTDAFNPITGWVSPDVTGLNLGITMLSAENLRSGSLWRWFMAAAEPRRALELAGIG